MAYRRVTLTLVGSYASYGAFWGTWAVAFPRFLDRHDYTPGEVSLGFALISVVAIAVMAFVAPRLEPWPRHISLALALGIHAVGDVLLGVLPTGALAIGWIAVGFGTGLVDVFSNAAGHQVEVASKKPILQWIHAGYGAGGAIGAVGAGIAATNGASSLELLVGAGVLQGIACVAAWTSPVLRRTRGGERAGTFSLGAFRTSPYLLVPAVVVLFAFFVEGSMDVWAVIFLERTLGASIMASALGFAAFASAIALGRLFAGRVLFGLGHRRTILISAIGSLTAGSVAVITSSPAVASLAFLALGFALSAAAPAAFGMAGSTDTDAGLAIGAITTVGYSGFVFGPPIMGWLADNISLRASMIALVASTAGIAVAGAFTRSAVDVDVDVLGL